MPGRKSYDHQEALRLRDEGKSVREIAKIMGVSIQAIYQLLRKYKQNNKASNIAGDENVYLGGKAYNMSDVLNALSISKIFVNLTEEQVNDICYRIVENAIKAPQLEKQLKELKDKYEHVSTEEQRKTRELDKYKMQSIKERVFKLDAAVLHGD